MKLNFKKLIKAKDLQSIFIKNKAMASEEIFELPPHLEEIAKRVKEQQINDKNFQRVSSH